MGFIQWKSKSFFENGVKSSVRKVSVLLRHLKMSKTSLNGKVTVRSSSPMLLFFLCCLFQQNDKSSTFHDGLSAVWPLDPGRILGRDGSHVWPGASWRNSLRYQSPCEISMTVVHLAKLKISVPDIYISTTQTAREFRKQKLLGHLAFVRFIGKCNSGTIAIIPIISERLNKLFML